MATVLNFPNDRQLKTSIEKKIKKALESHEPETQAKKLAAVMAVFDKYSTGEESLVIHTPSDQPFSDAQVDAIREAVAPAITSSIEARRAMILDIIALTISVIDMECHKG